MTDTRPVPQTKGPKATLKELLEGPFRSEVSKVLVNGGSPDAFIRAALTAAVRNPKLYNVKSDSLWQCLFDLAQMGLYPDGRRAHLVPFGEQCQLIVDYKGIAELARRNGDVASIHCDVVHEGEHYICQYGTDGRLEHKPDAQFEDQPVICAYSFVRFLIPGSTVLVEEYTQMSFKAIERVRERSKSGKTGPWVTDWDEMAKKTVFRRHSKTLSLSPETRHAVEYGEEEEFGFRTAVPAIVPKSRKTEIIDEEPEGDIEPPEPPKPPKRTRTVAKEPEPPAEPQKSEPKATKAEPQNLFPKNEEEELQDDLASKLREAGLEFNVFAGWLQSIGAVSSLPAKVSELRLTMLKQAVENWDANLVALRNWMDESTEKPF